MQPMKNRNITQNYIFRKFECRLTKEETAELCFKSVRTVTRWDAGCEIPPECKRLMRLYTCREIGISEEWEGWRIEKNKIISREGWALNPDRIIMGECLIEIGAPTDASVKTKLVQYSRAFAKARERSSEKPRKPRFSK